MAAHQNQDSLSHSMHALGGSMMHQLSKVYDAAANIDEEQRKIQEDRMDLDFRADELDRKEDQVNDRIARAIQMENAVKMQKLGLAERELAVMKQELRATELNEQADMRMRIVRLQEKIANARATELPFEEDWEGEEMVGEEDYAGNHEDEQETEVVEGGYEEKIAANDFETIEGLNWGPKCDPPPSAEVSGESHGQDEFIINVPKAANKQPVSQTQTFLPRTLQTQMQAVKLGPRGPINFKEDSVNPNVFRSNQVHEKKNKADTTSAMKRKRPAFEEDGDADDEDDEYDGLDYTHDLEQGYKKQKTTTTVHDYKYFETEDEVQVEEADDSDDDDVFITTEKRTPERQLAMTMPKPTYESSRESEESSSEDLTSDEDKESDDFNDQWNTPSEQESSDYEAGSDVSSVDDTFAPGLSDPQLEILKLYQNPSVNGPGDTTLEMGWEKEYMPNGEPWYRNPFDGRTTTVHPYDIDDEE